MCYDYSVAVCVLFRTGGKEFILRKNLKGKDCGKGIYQRKDGLYSARFVDKTGKRHEKYFQTVPEARKHGAQDRRKRNRAIVPSL